MNETTLITKNTPELAQSSTQVSQAPGSGEAIGKVEVAKGNAFIIHTDGSKVPAKIGQSIYQGDAIETDGDGSIGLVFADNSTFSLADEGRMVIDEMVYDPGTQEGTSVLNVAQGVFTFVSGQIAKTDVDAMVIKTATSTIGIRGTSGGGRAAPEGETNTFTLFADPDGTVGEATVTTQVGTQILNQVNQTTLIKSAFQPPSRPVVMPPQVVEKFYAKAAQALPPSPSSSSESEDRGAQTEGNEEGPVEGEGTAPGEAEEGAEVEAEASAEGEQRLEGEGEQPLDGLVEGESEDLAEGAADGPQPGGSTDGEIQQAGNGSREGEQIEQVAIAAADEAARQAIADGASLEDAQQAGQQAALDAAITEARAQGITDAEINAATAAFDDALASGASLEDAFFAAGSAADSAGREAAIQFDEQQAQLGDSATPQGIANIQIDGPDDRAVQQESDAPDDSSSGSDGSTEFQFIDDLGQVYGDGFYDPLDVELAFDPTYEPIDYESYELYETFNYEYGTDEFQYDDEYDTPPVINEFEQFITDFSASDDIRIGNDLDTRFEMSIFGGNDTLYGNGGTDEVAFIDLENAYGVYDATGATPVITFQDGDTNTSGSVTMEDVEQIYASIPGGAKFRVNAEDSSGYGIVWAGDDGNDSVNLSSDTLTFTNHSGANFDTSVSTNSNNILGTIMFGADGHDSLTGAASKENQMYGGSGSDTLTGGSASDTLEGGAGNDSLYGSAGNDVLFGGTEDDFLHGGTGSDELFGGTGDDYLSGAADDDHVEGNAGADTLIGGAGNDSLSGGAGADDVQGGSDDDYLFGNDGADTLTGGTGSDSLTGGADSDRFVFSGAGASGLGTDTLTDFSGTTAFGGGSGDGDKIVLDTSNLGINTSIAYEEVTWDGTTGAITLGNANANVIVLTGASGSQANALAALVAGNAAGDSTSADAVILFHDNASGDRLTMLHTDDASSGSANANILAGFADVTDTVAAANLDAADFTIQV